MQCHLLLDADLLAQGTMALAATAVTHVAACSMLVLGGVAEESTFLNVLAAGALLT